MSQLQLYLYDEFHRSWADKAGRPERGIELNGKTLVAYFSASGTTARVAKQIADTTGADLYEIRPAELYTEADLDWTNKSSRSTLEMKDKDCRPAIAEPVDDMPQYDTVFLGFPVWWYVEPRIVDSFLDSYDLSGKTIVPFATSGGSGIDKAENKMRAEHPRAKWAKGRLLNGGDADAWAKDVIGD